MMQKKINPSKTVEDILQDMLIVQLAQAGVPQTKIREIVGVDMYRVSRIVKNINSKQYGQSK